MKKEYIILTSLFVLAGIVAMAKTITKNVAPKARKILFIGDSNTAANYSYADQLKKMVPNVQIKKIAQNGAKTSWGKTQLEQELKKYKYDVVVILLGSNDVYGGENLSTTKNNLNYMYALAHQNGAKVLGVTPPNKDYYVNRTDINQKELSDLVNWMKTNKSIDYFIDFKSLTANKNLFNASDGFQHPNSTAYGILASRVKSILKL